MNGIKVSLSYSPMHISLTKCLLVLFIIIVGLNSPFCGHCPKLREASLGENQYGQIFSSISILMLGQIFILFQYKVVYGEGSDHKGAVRVTGTMEQPD